MVIMKKLEDIEIITLENLKVNFFSVEGRII